MLNNQTIINITNSMNLNREALNQEKREKAWTKFLTLPPTFTDIADSVEYVNNLRNDTRLKDL